MCALQFFNIITQNVFMTMLWDRIIRSYFAGKVIIHLKIVKSNPSVPTVLLDMYIFRKNVISAFCKTFTRKVVMTTTRCFKLCFVVIENC